MNSDFRIAHVAPVYLLESVKDDFVLMCSAQMLYGSELFGIHDRTFAEYGRFFDDAVEDGKYVILGNDFYTKYQLDFQTYYRLIDELQPSEFITPYYHGDMARTLESFYIWRNDFQCERKIKRMAVPQGKTFEEWKFCLDIMLQDGRLDVIGIDKKIDGYEEFDFKRGMMQYLFDRLDDFKRYDIEVHLLEVDTIPKATIDIVNYFSRVRSLSTCIALRATMSDADLWDTYKSTRDMARFNPFDVPSKPRYERNKVVLEELFQIDNSTEPEIGCIVNCCPF